MSTSNASLYGPDVISPTGEILQSPYYNYLVTEWVCIVFVVLYGATTALHLGQAFYFRMWFLLPTACLAGVGETIGWSGRLWSSISPLLQDPFIMQIVATIIAPTPFVAAIFIIFARITERLGEGYSRLGPRWYSRIFLGCDLVSLFVQSAGGGLAATASDDTGSNLGANIMLAGIIFQLVSLVVFITLAIETIARYLNDKPVRQQAVYSSQNTLVSKAKFDPKLKLQIAGLSFITICIFIRSIYRTAELADGWNGRIISTQVYFNVLDGAMVVLSMLTLNFLHPGLLLAQADAPVREEMILLDKPGVASHDPSTEQV